MSKRNKIDPEEKQRIRDEFLKELNERMKNEETRVSHEDVWKSSQD